MTKPDWSLWDACAYCSAPAGEPCHTPSGRLAGMVHQNRPGILPPIRTYAQTTDSRLKHGRSLGVTLEVQRGQQIKNTTKARKRRARKNALLRKRGFGA